MLGAVCVPHKVLHIFQNENVFDRMKTKSTNLIKETKIYCCGYYRGSNPKENIIHRSYEYYIYPISKSESKIFVIIDSKK